jgi:hypothetical protein
METVVHIALTPESGAHVTPLELLEDFADASLGWHYLEEESAHYAAAKDARACVLRHRRPDVEGEAVEGEAGALVRYVDFAFAQTDPADLNDVELVLIDAPTPEQRLDLGTRNALVDDFLQEMREYLTSRPGHASLRVATDDVDPETLG